VGSTGGHNDLSGFSPYLKFTSFSGVADGVDEIRKTVRLQVKNGADVIKMIASAGVLSEEESVGAPQYSQEEMNTVVQEAAMWGRKVAAHAHGAEAIKRALRAGVVSVEHASLIDDEGLALAKERGAWLAMDIYNDDFILEEYKRLGYPQKILDKEARIGKVSDEERKKIARAVGLGAIIFNDLRTKRTKDVEFDWERILNFEGATGPYCQNAHVRCCGILRKFGQDVPAAAEAGLLTSAEEFDLVKRLRALPGVIGRAAEEYEPSVVAVYMLELAMAFNVFLARHRVLGEDEKITGARVLLTDGVRNVLATCLRILGMEVLERM